MKTSFRVVFHAEDVKDQNRSALACQLMLLCRRWEELISNSPRYLVQ